MKIALMGGMGYPYTEMQAGMPTLKTTLEALGAEVILVNWAERQSVYNFMHGYNGFRAYLGDSLGAGSAAQYPGDVDGPVNFAGGFQPSVYDARSHSGYMDVAKNVENAVCIYNPSFIETMGLGAAQYRVAPYAKTKLLTIQHYAPHPDDWAYSQGVMLAHLKPLMGK